ncbi:MULTISPECIES: hypothetical protein [Amycolatopsis]|uniref:Secreted protein n=1 Tax=Amycolatopsis thermalba TaxID=944492 RepID=A0ABY4P4C3_9PSEU|nr:MULTISPECIES: hypothetical protein [Amycolatopsis]OXM73055.1 hypothetical protein CF166_11055 [Amycolatopsis sp. KNN50.9b]UQS27235.1 hypothetical protein L1857_32750 [Amycolatopsis thermalba]
MKLRKTLLTAGTIATVTTAVLAGTGVASADVDYDHVWPDNDGTAKVYVKENGDVLSVCDTKADGKAARMHVYVGDEGDPRYSAYATNGKGTCVTRRAKDGGAYNLPEGRRIWVYFGNEDGAGNWTSRSYVNDH